MVKDATVYYNTEGGGTKSWIFQTELGPMPVTKCDQCYASFHQVYRGGSRNSLRGGGVLGQNSSKGGGGGGVRVQVQVQAKKHKKTLKGGLNPLKPPSGSATGIYSTFK